MIKVFGICLTTYCLPVIFIPQPLKAVPDIETLIGSVKRLPTSPQILPKLQRLLRDPDSSLIDIAELVKLDAGLSAQIVRMSNSAYYGVTDPCTNIEDSVTRLGFNEVYKLVGATISNQVLAEELPLYNMESGKLWEDSILCGAVMQSLASRIGADYETAYTVGLLHGVGKVILNRYHNEHGLEGYVETLEGISPTQEYEILGYTNASISAALMRSWNFPEEICTPIEFQYSSLDAPEHHYLSVLLSLTREAVLQLDEDPEELYETFRPDPVELGEVGLKVDDLIEAALDSQSTVEWLTASM